MDISRRLLIKGATGLAAVGSLGLAGRAWAEDFTMKLTTTASNDLDSEWLNLLKQGVESASAGKIKANVYPASQLGSGETTVEGVTMGTVEVALNASGIYEGLEPRFAVLSVPGVVTSMSQGAKVYADPAVRERLGKIAAPKGVAVITAMMHSPVGIVSRKPITTLADFKGMKIRVPGSALLIAQLKELGASPIAMSLGEVLPAFQNGTIDGVYAGTTIFSALKYYDISKSLTLLPGTFIVMLGLVNGDFMKSLGALEAVVVEQAHKADVAGATWGETDVTNAQAAWEKNGGKTITLPEADAKQYLDIVVPTALRNLSADARADYEVLKTTSAKYT
ncbi:MAG TPA: TRAP transporter substrate-binding protein [Aliidongia sp.]|uniref:TRAP transporter substrate-binding protein n=1 Tax=Aliidongia sp. TaxID=1914230 RepID=UPI002DDCE442|nr:TRAP transporter substrate-binding protein [Aliidongia sp.]HEV2675044.1 TRAP transporter substrate-binding protein [Aliidongia sp.]